MNRWRGSRAFTIIATCVVLSMTIVAVNIGGPGGTAAQFTGGTKVETASDEARLRLHPTLVNSARNTPDAWIKVHAYILAGTDVSAYIPDGLQRAYVDANNLTIVSGTVQARHLLKMASVEGVLMVEPMLGAYAPTSEPGSYTRGNSIPDADMRARMNAQIQNGEKNLEPLDGADYSPSDWHDILATHNSKLVWEKGFTGSGVTAMVNDSGVDWAHPDMMGTWATVTDSASPYAGWPMMFDAYSMFLLARDQILGEANIASGFGQYADTSTVVTEGNSSYQPLDGSAPNTYSLTGTSQSGDYHIGTHPDTTLMPWYFIATGIEPEEGDPGQRPAILVVDENTAGVYDTVYVDLDFNNDFSDEKAITRDSPISGADWWGTYDPDSGSFDPNPDGFYDISGGLAYFIADGVNAVPASDWWWGLIPPANGSLVAFSINDFNTSPAGNHGMLVASGMTAQGVIDGDSYGAIVDGDVASGERPDYKPADAGGMVQAAGKDVSLTSAGDFYSFGAMDAFYFAALGYDGIPFTSDDTQIINNSWGNSTTHNEGWDSLSRLIDSIGRTINPTLAIVFAVGNGSPGFGTVTAPAPPWSILVGASTQHGSTNWDSATTADQITYGDISSFSGRGPSSRGTVGVDIVASGSRASGDVPLNEAMSGVHAWTTWGGTSRAAPVLAGNLALVYQAFLETYGGWPTADTAKTIIKSGARSMGYDPFLEGAGVLDANRAVDLAAGIEGTFVWPNEWNVGGWNGESYPGFANVILPGETQDEDFYITNPSSTPKTITISDRWLQKVDTYQFDWTSQPISVEPITLVEGDPSETELDWNTPHYLFDVTDMIPADADMVVFRQNYSYDQYDPGYSYAWEQVNDFYLLAYDWYDVNGNGSLWADNNGNGVVDDGEIDRGEYMRFEYSNARANTGYLTISQPHQRIHDGIFVAFQHNQARADIPQTSMTVAIDIYKQVDMPYIEPREKQVTVAAGETRRVQVRANFPGNTPPGVYEGGIVFDDGYWQNVVPFSAIFAPNRHDFTSSGDLGDGYYNNGQIYGAQSWRWREESGDWRFFYTNNPATPGALADKMPDGEFYFIADVEWGMLPTDVNLHIMSPSTDQFSETEPEYFGPYPLMITSSSNSGYDGDGVYRTETSSGTHREVIAGPYREGLNGILLHNVNYSGEYPSEPVTLKTGAIGVANSPVTGSGKAGSDTIQIEQSVASTIELSGLEVRGFGLSTPDVQTDVPILQDNPNDPSTSSYTREITLQDAGLLEIATTGQETDDIDLYLYYDENGDGEFDFDTELVAASTTSTAEEFISIQLPPDGNYLIAVHGWAVPAGSSTFDIAVNAVQGDDITTAGAPEGHITANRTYSFNITIDASGLVPGVYSGLVTIGPPEGPSAVLVPVIYTVEE